LFPVRANPSVGGDTKLSSSHCDFDTIPKLQVLFLLLDVEGREGGWGMGIFAASRGGGNGLCEL